VQIHPEASTGRMSGGNGDSHYLFARFTGMMGTAKG
jgi:carbamoylphosphate synthase small subunit